MPYIDPSNLAALRGPVNIGLFFRVGTVMPLRLWLGVNDVPIGIESIDGAGSVYTGAGQLLNLPDLEILVNGIADRVDFSLNGIDPALTANLATGAPSVLGSPVHVGFAPLDARWQPMTSIIPVWVGTGEFWAESQPVERDPTKPMTRTITLTAAAGNTARSRPRLMAFTDSAQRLRYPTDRFFERTARYTQTYSISWPRF